jgi:hypothetical protein
MSKRFRSEVKGNICINRERIWLALRLQAKGLHSGRRRSSIGWSEPKHQKAANFGPGHRTGVRLQNRVPRPTVATIATGGLSAYKISLGDPG